MLQLKVVSPEKVMFDGTIESIVVPGTLGRFEILVDHAPIISSLEKGEVDDLPEQAFLNVGTIEDAKEKGKKLMEAAKG